MNLGTTLAIIKSWFKVETFRDMMASSPNIQTLSSRPVPYENSDMQSWAPKYCFTCEYVGAVSTFSPFLAIRFLLLAGH